MIQENIVILLKVFLMHKWRELYIQSSFDDERSFAKIIAAAGLVGRVGMPSLSFQPTIRLILKASYPAIS